MIEGIGNPDPEFVKLLETLYNQKRYKELAHVGAVKFAEFMNIKHQVHKEGAKKGLTSEEIENLFPPEFRGTHREIVNRFRGHHTQ